MFFDSLLELIFPSRCLGCGDGVASGSAACEKCLAAIKINRTLFCGKCRARLPGAKRICHRDFPYVLGAASDYDNETIKSLIHGLKFRNMKSAARPLAELIVKYADSLKLPLEKFSVIPLPLSSKRLRERGYNQSELVAQIFAARFGLAFETNVLCRAKHTKPQSETKSLAERKENIRSCFAVNRAEAASGKNFILIDDVTTSGATLFEAAAVLKSAGARKILAMTVAKA
jgi:ComF family protein